MRHIYRLVNAHNKFEPIYAKNGREIAFFLAQTRHFLANFVATFGRFPSGLWEYEKPLERVGCRVREYAKKELAPPRF